MKTMLSRTWTFFVLATFLLTATPAMALDSTSTAADQLDPSLRLTWADGNEAVDAAGTDGAANVADFQQGSWSFQAYGSATFGDDAGELYLGHVGVGYYIWDHISVNFEGLFGIVESDFTAPDGDGYAVGFDLLARWHFCNWGDLSINAVGGIGMVWFEENFPQAGTHQNFTPQFGVEASYRIADACRLMGGVRWHHISNARKSGKDRNPGFDGAMVYLGVMLPF